MVLNGITGCSDATATAGLAILLITQGYPVKA